MRKVRIEGKELAAIIGQIEAADPSDYAADRRPVSLRGLIEASYDTLQAKLDAGWTLDQLAALIQKTANVQFSTNTLRNYMNLARKKRNPAAGSQKKEGEPAGEKEGSQEQEAEAKLSPDNPGHRPAADGKAQKDPGIGFGQRQGA